MCTLLHVVCIVRITLLASKSLIAGLRQETTFGIGECASREQDRIGVLRTDGQRSAVSIGSRAEVERARGYMQASPGV